MGITSDGSLARPQYINMNLLFITLIAAAATTPQTERENETRKKVKVGDLLEHHHGVLGEVYASDEETILIENFHYDGAGPDTFLFVGTEGSPESLPDEDKIFILDVSGDVFQYRDSRAPVLGRFDGETVTFKMPANVKVGDLKWISVYDRKFSIDFGSLTFPDNLGLSKTSEAMKDEEPCDDEDLGELGSGEAHHS